MNLRNRWFCAIALCLFTFASLVSAQESLADSHSKTYSTGECCILFKPLEKHEGISEANEEQQETIRQGFVDDWNKTLGFGSTAEGNASEHPLVKALADYEFDPNVKTALVALEQSFMHLAGDGAKEKLRHRAFGITEANPEGDPARIKLFLTLDVLKNELPLQAILKINAGETAENRKIAFSYRVGSSGKRFVELLEWRARGGNIDELSIGLTELLTKLINSDDDNTNTAIRDAIVNDPVLNEQLNGNRATDLIEEISGQFGHSIKPKTLKTEFLSPTKAYSVIRVRPPEPISEFDNFMGAYVVADEEKYRGLNAEEQLHKWGIKAGIAIDMRQLGSEVSAETLLAATKPYADTPDLMAMNGRYTFSTEGVRDLFGWAANNHRQIHDVHDGTLQDYAKYFLRDADWWARIAFETDANSGNKPNGQKLNIKSTPEMGRDYGIDFREGDFKRALEIAKIVREPPDADALKNKIEAEFGKTDPTKKAVDLFRRVELQIVEAAHRRNVDKIASGIETALKAQRERSPDGKLPDDLTIDKLINDKSVGGVDPEKRDGNKPNHDLRASMEVLATAYTNFTGEVVDKLGEQLADKITEVEAKANRSGSETHTREVTKFLRLAWEKVRDASIDTRRQARGFISIKHSFESIREALDEHTSQILSRGDLDAYIDQIIEGEVTQKRLVWDAETRRLRLADQQWTPEFIAEDVSDLKSMANLFFWDDRTVIENLHQYLHGDGSETFALRSLGALRNAKGLLSPDGRLRRNRVPDGNGGFRYFDTRPGRLAHGGNLVVIAVKMAFADGGAMVQSGWGVWGDISDGKMLADNLIKIFGSDSSGRTADETAVLHAMAMSKTIALADYAKHFSAKLQIPGNVGAYTGTLATVASLSSDSDINKKNIEALMIAISTDVILQYRPDLAAAFVAYDIGTSFYTYLTKTTADHALVQLLLANGIWDTETANGVPQLKGIYLSDGRVLMDDPESRKKACSPRPPGSLRPPSAGLMLLAKTPGARNGLAAGIKLQNDGIFLGTVDVVHPRRMLLNLFYADGYEAKDPDLIVSIDAIKSLSLTESLSALPSNTQLGRWTDKWFKEQKISLPVGEDDVNPKADGRVIVSSDAPYLESNRSKLLNSGSGSYWGGLGTAAVQSIQGAPEGLLKNFGYQVMHYRIQRQNILECAILDAVIKEAEKKKKDETVKVSGLSDLDEELARLRQRVIELDEKVWPNISDATGPFLGEKYDKEKDRPILAAYLDYTKHLRSFLQEAIYFAETGQLEENPMYRRYYLEREPGRLTPDISELEDKLREKARETLQRLIRIVRQFEDYWDGNPDSVLNSMKASRRYVRTLAGAGKGFDPWRFDLPLRLLKSVDDGIRPQVFPIDHIDPGPPDVELGGDLSHDILFAKQDPRGPLQQKQTKEWFDGYKKLYTNTRESMGDNIVKLVNQSRPLVRQLGGSGGSQRTGSQTVAGPDFATAGNTESADPSTRSWWQAWENYWDRGAEEMAIRHPLWPHVMRLAMQSKKIDNMLPFIDRIQVERLPPLIGSMYLNDPRYEGSKPVDGSDFKAADLATLKKQFDDRRAELIKLAGGMINISVTSSGNNNLAVSEVAEFEVDLKPKDDLDGPTIKQFRQLVGYYQWEIVQTGRYVASGAGVQCTSGHFISFDTAKKIPIEKGDKPDRFRIRMVSAGSYAVKVTALTKDHIPLATALENHVIEVQPMGVAGEVVFEGVPDVPNPDISLFMGPDTYLSATPMVQLASEGKFEHGICHLPYNLWKVEAHTNDAGAADTWQPPPWKAYAAQRRPGPEPSARQAAQGFVQTFSYSPSSRMRNVVYVPRKDGNPPRWLIPEPMVLFFGNSVEVIVNLRDAADGPVASDGIEITLAAGNDRYAGSSPFNVPAKSGQSIVAEVSYKVAGKVLTRNSRIIEYDTKVHGGIVTLNIRLPFYEIGNLHVSGNFKATPSDEAPNPVIAGAAITVNALEGRPTIVRDGGRFKFTNERRVLISEGIRFSGILHDRDDWMYAPATTAQKLDANASRQKFNDVAVSRHKIWISPIHFKAVDYAGRELPANGSELVPGGKTPSILPDPATGVFSIGWLFEKYHEEVEILIIHETGKGEQATGSYGLKLEALGGPEKAKAPSALLEVPIPLFLPGSLLVSGQFELDTTAGNAPSDVEATVIQGATGGRERWQARVGQPFRFDISEIVLKRDIVDVLGEAGTDPDLYTGAGTAQMPTAPSENVQIANVGTITLSLGNGEARCLIIRDRISKARDRMAKGEFTTASSLLDDAEKLFSGPDDCAGVASDIAAVRDRITVVSDIAGHAEQAITSCGLAALVSAEQKITLLTPPSPFLDGKLPAIARLIEALEEVRKIRSRNYLDADSANKLVSAQLRQIGDLTTCPADISDGSADGHGQEPISIPPQIEILVEVKGDGFVPMFSMDARQKFTTDTGLEMESVSGSTIGIRVDGNQQFWVKIRRGESQDVAKKRFHRGLISQFCSRSWSQLGPGSDGQVSARQPEIWHHGPHITTVAGPFLDSSEYDKELVRNWSAGELPGEDGPWIFMDDLHEMARTAKDCGEDCCRKVECIDGVSCGLEANN